MKKFDLTSELKSVVQTKQLIELSLPIDEEAVAYILRVNKEFVTLAEISASFALLAVSTYRISDIKSINLSSIYLDEFTKQITNDSLYKDAAASIESMRETGFENFLKAFSEKDTLVEITKDDENSLQGRIVSYNDKHVVLDEYYVHYDGRYARTVINRDNIVCMAVNTPRIRILARSLKVKQI